MVKPLIFLFSLLAIAPSHLARAEETAADVIAGIINQAASADVDADHTVRWLEEVLNASEEVNLLDQRQLTVRNFRGALSGGIPKDVSALLEDENFFSPSHLVLFSFLDFTNDGSADLMASWVGGTMHCVRYRYFTAIEDGYFLQVDGPDTRTHQMEGGVCSNGGRYGGAKLLSVSVRGHIYFLLVDGNSLRFNLDLFDINSPFWTEPVMRITAMREFESEVEDCWSVRSCKNMEYIRSRISRVNVSHLESKSE